MIYTIEDAVAPSPSSAKMSTWSNPTPSPTEYPTVTPSASSTSTPSAPSVSPSMSPSKSPTPHRTPSRSPSSTPTPYAIYIGQSLHGNREPKDKDAYVIDTTVNIPVEISLADLFQDKRFSNPSSFSIQPPSNGTMIIKTNSITYIPNPWFTGKDSFRCVAKGENIFRTVQIRVQTGVVLYKALMNPPASYNFSEANPAQTNEIKVAFKTLINQTVYPERDNWLDRRYNTCAIVGNGGSLIGRKRGAEIDSHDIVVRINLSPFLNHTEDVGSKLNISVANGPTSAGCWKRPNLTMNFEILAQASFRVQFKHQQCQQTNPDVKYLPMSYLFVDLVDSILNEYQRVKFNGTVKKYRSTGMMAVTAMSMICDHVSMYGFERGPNMENTYYKNQNDREWMGHSYPAEKEYFKDLAKGTGLFEPFLENYDLYKTFDYIVD